MTSETTHAEEREQAFVLAIDDETDSLRPDVELGLGERARAEVVHPQDISIDLLQKADLVVVDYRINDWDERDGLSNIALRPSNGIALTTLLRERVDEVADNRLTAFALHTGHIDDLRGRLPEATAQHVLARLHNLEWVFRKADLDRWDQMISLADAVRRLPQRWTDDEEETAHTVASLLALDQEKPWYDRCWRDVQECQPPVHHLRDGGHGLLFVRWILHTILPYPCFLSETHWVAARLRIPVEDLRAVVAGNSELAGDLEGLRYNGILHEFLGPRWWRGALENYLWNVADGAGVDAAELHEKLEALAGQELRRVRDPSPVVYLNADLQPTGQLGTPAAAVRLRPDHWPAFADAPWMDIGVVQQDARLRAMVHPLEQDRLELDDEE